MNGLQAPIAVARLGVTRRLETLPWPLLVRFAGGTLVNTAFGYSVFVLLLVFGLPTAAALVAATLLGIVFNYQTSRVVFRSHRTGLLLRFAVVYLVLIAVNYALLLALGLAGLRNWLGQALLVGPMGLAAFAAQRLFVFGPARGPSP